MWATWFFRRETHTQCSRACGLPERRLGTQQVSRLSAPAHTEVCSHWRVWWGNGTASGKFCCLLSLPCVHSIEFPQARSLLGRLLTSVGPRSKVQTEAHIPSIKYREVINHTSKLLSKIYSWQIKYIPCQTYLHVLGFKCRILRLLGALCWNGAE